MKGLDHQLQTLVGSPFSKSQNAMLGIATPGHIRELRLAGKNSVGTEMHIIAAVFFMQNFSISRHEHGNGVGEKKHARSHGSGQPIGARVTHASILQIHGVDEMVQRDVGVATAQTGKQRSGESGKSNQRIAAESAEKQIEPNHIRFLFADRVQNAGGTGGIVKRPAALHRKFRQFRPGLRKCVGKNREPNKGIAL